MTNITVLAQSLKRRATSANEFGESLYVKGADVIALVEALEKAQQSPIMPLGLHPDTQKLVADFCTALAEKLYKAQLKYGYDTDWKQDGWTSQCQAHFHQHIAKGDPRDVAAYCAFMWWHGWSTKPAEGLESRTVTDWIEHDGKWRPELLGLDELVYLKTRKQELKIPYPAGKVKGWMHAGGDMDVMAYKLASPQASTVTVKLPDDAEHDIMAPVAAYLSEKFKWDGSAARWDGRKEYDVLADRVKYALRMVIRRAAGIKVEAE
ncbi:hypothetical protein ACNPE2_10385 [Klebsiella pneumoniae]|uniref:hypothetical protein n=1 Tax=Klebsiella pneumoniae TaxID=573 RepID=UPI001D0EB2E9|nr:hypothetical protein [Klebsiella pneumoniae]MCX2664129.1 hypothetical protein [Klebsiella pneumoniae]MDW7533104.1 hypothetical protein [Klebsiella pneumoniae]MDZ5677809.1 hypothetical protein [Klebsiella pneumoniae]